MTRADHAREVRSALADPRKLCESLGLLEGAKRQASGMLIRCPVHGEKDPSCSVTTGPDGTVRVRCFACDFSGDALTLIAHIRQLSPRSQFRELLALGADLAGALQLRDEILAGAPIPERKPISAPAPRAEVDYPPLDEVRSLWQSCVPVCSDADAWEALRGRGIDPESVDQAGAARVIPDGAKLPRWARYGGATWQETGHRLLVPAWNHQGQLRSVRAWRITDGDTPKRLPPAGHKAAELVMANRWAVMMLRGLLCPKRLVVTEGEPDTLSAIVSWAHDAIVGVFSGAWTVAFGQAVPRGTEVLIATHHDSAGDRYAMQVMSTLSGRAVWRTAA